MPDWLFKKVKALLKPVGDGISSKTGEKIGDAMVGAACGIFTLKADVKHLEQDSARLRSVAFDMETELKKEELGGRKKRKREVKMWLEEESNIRGEVDAFMTDINERYRRHLTSNGRMEKLNKRVKNLLQQRQNMGELVVDEHTTKGERLLTSKLCGVAFHEKVKEILKCLEDPKVGVIGIHGIAGVGKTEVAKHLHNLVLERQDHVYWVSISENTSIKKLQDDISCVIGLTLSSENEECKRAAKLNSALMQSKDIVLVLDNLGENIDLEVVGYPLNVEGYKLIVTSRSPRVCLQVGCQKLFKVETLGEEDTWKLFAEVFGKDIAFAPGVEEIARSTVQMYSGLPQGIIKLW